MTGEDRGSEREPVTHSIEGPRDVQQSSLLVVGQEGRHLWVWLTADAVTGTAAVVRLSLVKAHPKRQPKYRLALPDGLSVPASRRRGAVPPIPDELSGCTRTSCP